MRDRDAPESRRSVSRVEEFLRTARTLLAEAEKSASEQRLVMKVGSELASSLEYETTLRNVAHLVVDEFADWCIVELVDRDGRVRDVAVAHRDAQKEEVARTLVRNLPQLPSAPHGVARVLRTLQTEKCTSEVDEPPPLGHYLGAEYPDALRELGARSYICCPLIAGDKAIGAITYVRDPSSLPYDDREVSVASELARRAAMAIENATLHRDMEQAVRARDELLAIFSHDVRNLLNAIRHNVDLIREAGSAGEPESLARISRATQRMKQLVDDTLDVSRVEANGLPLDPRVHDLDAIVSDAVDAVWSSARTKDVRIEMQVTPGLRLLCDPTRMFQVLFNLLDNAVRHSPSGGCVAVKAAGDHESIHVSISDSGAGISDEELPHVFDRFWRGRNPDGHGAGLGLTIVKGIVEAHGGRIAVESALGEGTTFRFSVPLRAERRGERRPTVPPGTPVDSLERSAPSSPPTVSAPRTVLLADDDADFRRAVKDALVARGHGVLEASDGAMTLELLSRAADENAALPDVVMLDVRMPGCSGLGVLNAMVKLPRMPPTLLVTGFKDPSINVLADRLGVFRVLFKPVEVARVVAAVLEAAERAPEPHRAAALHRPREGSRRASTRDPS